MLSKEDNDILTQTNRGTPMGEIFRRFWIPVLLSEEIPLPDCPPVRFRVLGEVLLAFRDTNGRVGVIDPHCPHRGAPLYFGRNEECGLRCIYHGWKYDVDGNCVDLPNVPNGDVIKKSIRIMTYPTTEQAGMVWAYMGPPERKPPLPNFAYFGLPEENFYVAKYHLQCNWLQAHEGDFDYTHGQFLHSAADAVAQVHAKGDRMPRTLPGYDTPIGHMHVTARWLGDGNMQVSGRHIVYPSFCPPGTGTGNGVFAANIRIPIDDENEWHFRLRYAKRRALTQGELLEFTKNGFAYDFHEPNGWRAVGNKDNDYLQDRVLQRQFNFSGMSAFQRQDAAMLEDQFGAICDRTKEHLIAPDISMVQQRNRLLAMAKNLAAGKEPEEPFILASLPIKQELEEPLDTVTAGTSIDDATADRIAKIMRTARIVNYAQAVEDKTLAGYVKKPVTEGVQAGQ